MKKLLGETIYNLIDRSIPIRNVTEIRLRLGKPLVIKTTEKSIEFPLIITEKIISDTVSIATGFSRYAHEEEISDGYVPYGEGIRIGLCGSATINDRGLLVFRTITSLNIRIPHTIRPNPYVYRIVEDFHNTLIVGPPCSGKTTMIRALCEKLSERFDVTILDERSEIVGHDGSLCQTQYADVIQGVPKSRVYENVVRCMSPQIVVCDEMFSQSDVEAVQRLTMSGIRCLASYHAKQIGDVPESIKKIFSDYVVLTYIPKPGTIQSIERYDR